MTVNILGAEYKIEVKKYREDDSFEEYKSAGYCSCSQKKIVLCDMSTYPGWNTEKTGAIKYQTKKLLRHEIVHAFLEESGLSTNSNDSTGPWARNEEIVDWIALQGPKIYEAWEEADAI